MEHCERCGAEIDEAAKSAGRCQRCGKRLPVQMRRPEPGPPERLTSETAPPRPGSGAAGTPAPLEDDQIRVHTDGEGAFSIYTGDRSYEFRQGAGCDERDITRSMVRMVMGYMDRHNSVVSVTTFFAMLGTALEERRDLTG
jgi:DNA-directed RNA polymerase subunit RPC12/RpoP